MAEPETISENYFFGLKPTANIYRYTTVERLMEMINEKKLVLVKPSLWEDPFENILSKVIYNDGKNDISLRGITDNCFAQSWTKSKECDGLWRNYTNMNSSPNNGVKITTQAHKLYQYVSNCDNDRFCDINTFIGNIKYDKDENIINFFKTINIEWIMDPSGKNPSKTLFRKRNEFKYENEVRVVKIVDEHSRALHEHKLYSVEIDPLYFISSITFSPMMEDEIYLQHRNNLLNFGFNKKKISKSILYKSFSDIIRII